MSKEFEVLPYQIGEEGSIVQLLENVFNGWPHLDINCTPLDYWKWMYQDNPLDTELIVLAKNKYRIIGVVHSIILKIKMSDKTFLCSIGGDVAVLPDFRKMGVWKNILKMINGMRKENEVHYNYIITENPIVIKNFIRSRDHHLFPYQILNLVRIKDIDKQLRMMPVKYKWLMKIGFYITKLVNKMGHNVSNSDLKVQNVKIIEIDTFDYKINSFWEEISKCHDYIVERKMKYLNWRYCDRRAGDFIIKQAVDDQGRILGYCVLRINRYYRDYPVGFIVDLIAIPDRPNVVNILVMDAVQYFNAKNVNIINYQVVKGHPYEKVIKAHGFLDSRIKIRLFYNSLQDNEDIRRFKTSQGHRIHVSWGDHHILPVKMPITG